MDINDYIQNTYVLIRYLGNKNNIMLVKSKIDNKNYVLKIVKAYDRGVYDQLKSHPIKNIPQIYEIMENEQALYIVEEYIEGKTLDVFFDVPEYKNNNAEWMISKVIESICIILNDIHSLEPPIIHRDIKPQNIIITSGGDIKLIDFNISREYTGKADKDTVAMGTKGYAAPEQHGFFESDQRSDIYSLGATVKDLISITKLNSNKLNAFVEKAAAYSREDRFQNAVEVLYFLKNYGNSDFLLNNNRVDVNDKNIETDNERKTALRQYDTYCKKIKKELNKYRIRYISIGFIVAIVIMGNIMGIVLSKRSGSQDMYDNFRVSLVLCILFSIVIILYFTYDGYSEHKKMNNRIAITASVQNYTGKSPKALNAELKQLGFDNTKMIPIKVYSKEENSKTVVKSLTMGGVENPVEGMEFTSDVVITIVYGT
ncbi:MAG: protein kinase [Eubacterium sp.]|nr:protein kinase [Eubacterium sp.]